VATPALTIYRLDESTPIRLAAKDLARCLRVMTGAPVRVASVGKYDSSRAGIYLGGAEHFRGEIGKRVCAAQRWDDELLVRSAGDSLILTGSNERSVLFAAYRWLQALGAQWVRPGKEGEFLPSIAVPALDGWDIHEKAGARHRGIVIEGTCFIEQVLELIDWMPKLRANAYMLQFRTSAFFWRRWADRTDSRVIKNPRVLSMDECMDLDNSVVQALQDRGLLLHRVGHGWTSAAVGYESAGWEQGEPVSEAIRPFIAEVNGKRDWFKGVPINTELCYSNPEARKLLIDEILHYAAAHPEVDVLHFWTSDDMNNWCECANCAHLQPSDWYIGLANELSPRLAEINPGMKLVVLCYVDTVWPPTKIAPESIGDNVTFMFAPITRCYAHGMLDKRCTCGEVAAPFARNHGTLPRANEGYAAILKAWQDYLPAGTDSFSFDYHLLWSFPQDLIASDFSRMLRDDVLQYLRAGVDGILNCQTQRTSLPTALAQVAMHEYLWNPKLTVKELESAFFPAAFGPDAPLAQEFLTAYTKATGACAHLNEWWQHLTKRRTKAVRRVLADYLPLLRDALADCTHPVWRTSLKLLVHYIRYEQLLWRALETRVQGDKAKSRAQLQQVIDFLLRTEPQVYRWVDVPGWMAQLPNWFAMDEENVAPKATLSGLPV